MKKSIGIVGCGAVVAEYYPASLATVPDIEITAVTDRDSARAQGVADEFGAEALGLTELWGRCDWVLIATPPGSHAELVEQALSAGKSVFVEKPFVTDFQTAVRLVGAATAAKRSLSVGQFRRYFPPTELARDMVSSGIIGEIVRIEAFEGGKFSWAPRSSYVRHDPFGGVLFDTGSHTLDQAFFVAGLDSGDRAVKIVAVRRDKAEPSHEIDAQFELSEGSRIIEGRLFLSRARALANLVRVVGSRGELEVDCGLEGFVRVRSGGRSFSCAPQRGLSSPAQAFSAQFNELFRRTADARIAAERVLPQIRALESIYRHE